MISKPLPAVHSRYFHQSDQGLATGDVCWRKWRVCRSWGPSWGSEVAALQTPQTHRLGERWPAPNWSHHGCIFGLRCIRFRLDDSWQPKFLAGSLINYCHVLLSSEKPLTCLRSAGWYHFPETLAFVFDLIRWNVCRKLSISPHIGLAYLTTLRKHSKTT